MKTTKKQQELQSLFDRSLQHMRLQGEPSFARGWCRYRSGVLGCAASPFIFNYDDSLENQGWIDIADNRLNHSRLDPLAVKHSEFVGMLQDCHDDYASGRNKKGGKFMSNYEKSMKELSKEFKLKYTPPE